MTLTALAATAAGAAAHEIDIARPGGVYARLAEENANACAQACGEDALCMAWTYNSANNACELKAVTPAPQQQAGAISGLSARAPGFARLVSSAQRHVAQAAPDAPQLRVTTLASFDAPPAPAPAPPSDNSGLLGGPAGDPPPLSEAPARGPES